jgi:hypothetical protein
MTDRQIALFYFTNLLAAADGWSWMIKGMVNQEIKVRFNTIHNNLAPLMNLFQKELTKENPDHVEDFLASAEVFSKCIEKIKKAKTVGEKQELFLIMEAWTNGDMRMVEKCGENNEEKAA